MKYILLLLLLLSLNYIYMYNLDLPNDNIELAIKKFYNFSRKCLQYQVNATNTIDSNTSDTDTSITSIIQNHNHIYTNICLNNLTIVINFQSKEIQSMIFLQEIINNFPNLLIYIIINSSQEIPKNIQKHVIVIKVSVILFLLQ